MQNKISVILSLYRNFAESARKRLYSSISTDVKLVDYNMWEILLEKECTNHASLDDLKHQLKAKCMCPAGYRSHCDNYASVVAFALSKARFPFKRENFTQQTQAPANRNARSKQWQP